MTPRSIGGAFARQNGQGQTALVPYVTAGHPRPEATVELMQALADAGSDVIELGIPFSDPLADGPTIQRSSFASLSAGTSVERVLEDLEAYSGTREVPVVLFTYLNPVLRFGLDSFLRRAVDAGARGLLVTDLPTGADRALEEKIPAAGLDLIRLVAPTTPPERLPDVAASCSGFLYYISRTGVTGARSHLPEKLAEEVTALRGAVSLPVAVGFGISTPEQASAVGAVADGVVVGSALVQALDQGGIPAGAEFVTSLRRGLDGA